MLVAHRSAWHIPGLALASVLFAVPLAGQQPEQAKPASPDSVADSAAGKKAKPDDGRFRITPLLAPAYNPEMQFLIAGGVLLSWRAARKDTTLPRSSLTSTVSISTTGAINISNKLSSYFFHDRLRGLLDFSVKDMRDDYWGVGYDAGLAPYKGDSTTKYQREWWTFKPTVLYAVRPHLYLGLQADFNKTSATDVNPVMAADSAYQATGPKNYNSGLGIMVMYDSRDVPNNAYQGLYLGLSGMLYGPYIGSNNSYQIYLLDYRQYRPLGRPGRTLAWQVRTRWGYGAVPWAELSLLGSGYDFRGYREGRYRDNQTLSALVEFRNMFVNSRFLHRKHGVVAWVGLGTLGSNRTEFSNPLPNLGVGYRLEIQPRASVRIDAGWGKNSNGVYFNFQEAF